MFKSTKKIYFLRFSLFSMVSQSQSQQTKYQMMIWYFVRLTTIIFISNSDRCIIVFCTGPNHHYLYHIFQVINLILWCDSISSLAPLWLGSLSVTPSKKDILRWTIGCHIFFERSQLGLFLYLSKCAVVSFQMSLQIA